MYSVHVAYEERYKFRERTQPNMDGGSHLDTDEQTCQLSQFGRETHDFKLTLMLSRQQLQFTRLPELTS